MSEAKEHEERFVLEPWRDDEEFEDEPCCEAHGPNSSLAKRNRQAEADAEAAFWQGIPEF